MYIHLGYDNLNPSYYDAMRDRFQRGKCLKPKKSILFFIEAITRSLLTLGWLAEIAIYDEIKLVF